MIFQQKVEKRDEKSREWRLRKSSAEVTGCEMEKRSIVRLTGSEIDERDE